VSAAQREFLADMVGEDAADDMGTRAAFIQRDKLLRTMLTPAEVGSQSVPIVLVTIWLVLGELRYCPGLPLVVQPRAVSQPSAGNPCVWHRLTPEVRCPLAAVNRQTCAEYEYADLWLHSCYPPVLLNACMQPSTRQTLCM
jgi:hypothetical protein